MSTQELVEALQADPGNWELRLAVVESFVAEGKHDTAVEYVNQGEALPREPGPWLAAAKCYAAVGALEQANGLVESSLEIDPDYAPAKEYKGELESHMAAIANPVTPVPMSPQDEEADDDDEDIAVAVVADDEVEATAVPEPTPVAVPRVGSDDEPMTLPQVSFSNTEMEALQAAEEEALRMREAAIRRDKMNSVIVTVLLHVAVVALLMMVATKAPQSAPPQIVASSQPPSQEEVIENETMDKPTLEPTTAVNSAVADIISVNAQSSFSVSNLDVQISDVAVETGMSFTPSMSVGMPTSSESRMMFGQEMEGEVLGVILDVSGSMAEWLPLVVREVDKNFPDSPIVYVRNVVVKSAKSGENEVRTIIPDEVIPYDKELKTPTPYWFLWHDLPKKAPQRYVDRLIETFKGGRPNVFLTVGPGYRGSGGTPLTDSIDFLMEQDIDSLYIFSDFEDYVDEDVCLELGQKLGRRKIRTYVQPAEKGTEFLDVMTKKLVNRTLGRQLPSLYSILGDDVEAPEKPLTLTKNEGPEMPDVDFKHATPRAEIVGDGSYGFKPGKDWFEIHRIEEPEYTAVFYGPEARAYVFLKTADGYIQDPIRFYYHSWKRFPDHPDPRARVRRRKFVGLQEDPTFDGKEIVWKMKLEDDLKFNVHMYLGRKGMHATYTAEPPKDGTDDGDHISFGMPSLAWERKDKYFGYDLPNEGVKLDDVRQIVHPNTLIINLPRENRDRQAKAWNEAGFEMGYNTRHYDELIRVFPPGIRDIKVEGPSFGPRKIHARTTSGKVYLGAHAGRADTEPWEGFGAHMSRREDVRERFTKTEAIELEIE